MTEHEFPEAEQALRKADGELAQGLTSRIDIEGMLAEVKQQAEARIHTSANYHARHSDDEEQLADRARRGDAEALEQLLSKIRPGVLRWCARYLREPDAEEACLDVLLAVAQNITQFEGRSRFQTWLYAIASNCALGTYRRLKRRAGEQPVDRLPTVVEGWTTSVVAGTRIDLLEALEQLRNDKPDLAEPVVLRELGDLTYQEIADRLDLPIDTVKTYIRRGRLHLRESLATRDR